MLCMGKNQSTIDNRDKFVLKVCNKQIKLDIGKWTLKI